MPPSKGHTSDCWCDDCHDTHRDRMREIYTTEMAENSYDDAKEDYLSGVITFNKFVEHVNVIFQDTKDNLEILALLEEARTQKKKIDAKPKRISTRPRKRK